MAAGLKYVSFGSKKKTKSAIENKRNTSDDYGGVPLMQWGSWTLRDGT
jgi:hypothetical protein